MIKYATQVNLESQTVEENVSSKSTYQLRSCDRVFAPQTTDYQVSLPRQDPKPSTEVTEADYHQQMARGLKETVAVQPRRFHERMRRDLKKEGHTDERREAQTEPMPFCPGVCWKCGRKGHRFRECSQVQRGVVGFVTATCRAPGSSEATPCACPCMKHAIALTQGEFSGKCDALTDRYVREGAVNPSTGVGIQETSQARKETSGEKIMIDKPKSDHVELKKDLKKKKHGRDQPPKPR